MSSNLSPHRGVTSEISDWEVPGYTKSTKLRLNQCLGCLKSLCPLQGKMIFIVLLFCRFIWKWWENFLLLHWRKQTGLCIMLFFFFLATACSMWDLPQPGIKPMPLHWKCGVLTTKLPGNSLYYVLLYLYHWSFHGSSHHHFVHRIFFFFASDYSIIFGKCNSTNNTVILPDALSSRQ